MSKILVTGASGTIGLKLTEKLLEQGDEVWGMSRCWPKQLIERFMPSWKKDGFHPFPGDITVPDLDLANDMPSFDSCYHLAGLVNLSLIDKGGLIYKTNVEGTKNVVKYCLANNISHIYHCSTAYQAGNNPYENSKIAAEMIVRDSAIPYVTIFRPSLVLGGEQHFNQFVKMLIHFHKRMELIRRKVEGTMRLPVIEPAFRIKGNPGGYLNLIKAEDVAAAMAEINQGGVYWLTNSDPPTLKHLGDIVGEFCMMNLSFEKEFPRTPLEIGFERFIRPFLPYLRGDNIQDFSSSFISFKIEDDDIRQELLKLI